MTGRIVLNVTSSASWRRRPVGIIRVERELAKQLLRHFPERIAPVVLPSGSDKFKRLTEDDLHAILSDEWVSSDAPDQQPPIATDQAPSLLASATDTFVSVGSDWSYGIPELVSKLYGSRRVLVTACYDMIPLLFPEYTPDPYFKRQFISHYSQIAENGRVVFSISENSKNDLLSFWNGLGLSHAAPRIQVVPLAGMLRMQLQPLSDHEQNQLQHVLHAGSYAVFVSTIEPRKNHQMITDVWKALYAERTASCPQIVFVGMRGWGSDDFFVQLSRMDATKAGKVVWLEGVSDALLCHLYHHALFAVFPSVYEGWGLAATEALAFGKVCVTSNSSSLGEATGNRCPTLHPYDFLGWFREIRRLIDDVPYRESLEKTIKGMSIRSWDDFGDEFCKLVTETK